MIIQIYNGGFMANETQLNKRLQYVEKKYKAFTDSCQQKETEESYKLTKLISLISYMQKHVDLIPKFIQKLVSKGYVLDHECNLEIYEKLYRYISLKRT